MCFKISLLVEYVKGGNAMALSNASIYNGRTRTANIRSNVNNVINLARNLSDYLGQNANYNKFVKGTDIGKEQDEKVKMILKLLEQDLSTQTTNLTLRLNNFFDCQVELNRREAAKAAAVTQNK